MLTLANLCDYTQCDVSMKIVASIYRNVAFEEIYVSLVMVLKLMLRSTHKQPNPLYSSDKFCPGFGDRISKKPPAQSGYQGIATSSSTEHIASRLRFIWIQNLLNVSWRAEWIWAGLSVGVNREYKWYLQRWFLHFMCLWCHSRDLKNTVFNDLFHPLHTIFCTRPLIWQF